MRAAAKVAMTAAFAARGAVRMALSLSWLVGLTLLCALATPLGETRFDRLAMAWCRVACRILGIQPHYRGAPPAPVALVIGNHISWLDALLYRAHRPLTLLGGGELAARPLLGWIARRSGMLFIQRGHGAAHATAALCAALQRGRTVVLFPEGVTTDGRSVRRFQPRLMQAALDAEVPLQPAALRYVDTAGQRVVRHSFAGNTIPGSLWRTVTGRTIIAELTLLPPLAPGSSRDALARGAEDSVRALVEGGELAGGGACSV